MANTTDTYNPSKEELDYNAGILDDFDDCLIARRKEYPELDNMTPMRYVDESRMRKNGYLPKQDDVVGANVFFNKTNNKLNIIAGFVAAQRPRVEISSRGNNNTLTDKRIATILRNAYDYYMEKNGADEVYLDWTIETLETGTGFLMQYYDYQEAFKKDVRNYNWENGKKVYKKKKRVLRDEPRFKVVPFESLYFPTYYETDIQNYPYIIYREYILKSVAETIYGKFKNWKYVKTLGDFTEHSTDEEQFYKKRWGGRVQDGFVEILHRQSKGPDTHDIQINGVLMTDMDNPMLYDHKDYNIVPQYYQKIKGFILGKSLPMKLMYAQDAFNELMNSIINRSRSSSHLSFLASKESQIEQDTVGDYEIIRTDDDANLREFSVRSNQPGDVNVVDRLGMEIDEQSAPKSMSGDISGETATAIINAVRQSTQNLGPQLTYIYAASKKHAEMLLSDVLQFFFNANLKGEAFEMKEINIEDTKLQDGQKGIRIIRVVDSADKVPSKDAIEKEIEKKGIISTIDAKGNKVSKIETNYEIVYITPEDIADLTSKVKIIPGSSLPDLQSLDKALLLEMINTGSSPLLQKYPDFAALWKLVVEKFGYNPDDVTIPSDQLAQANQQELQAASASQPGQSMQGAPANSQLVDQMTGGSQPDLKSLLGAA